MSQIEALGLGIPVLASRTGGIPETITDGQTGCLLPPGDVQAWANAIDEALQQPERRQSLAQAGCQDVRHRFSPHTNTTPLAGAGRVGRYCCERAMNDSFKHSWQVYRRLLAYIQRYWKVLILSLISMTIAALTEAAFARLLKPLIDGGFVSKDPDTIRWVPLAIIGVFMLRGLTSFINEYTASWLTGRLVQTLREEMFAKLLRLPVSFYDESQSGRLISRIANDVNQVTEAGFNVITVAVKDGVTTLGLLALLLYTDWQLTLICFVVMPAVTACMHFVGKRLRGLARENQLRMAQMTQVVSESIDCQKVVKIYGGESYEIGRFHEAADALRRNQVKQSAASSANTGVTQLMIACALAAILYFAALRAQQGDFSAGRLHVVSHRHDAAVCADQAHYRYLAGAAAWLGRSRNHFPVPG